MRSFAMALPQRAYPINPLGISLAENRQVEGESPSFVEKFECVRKFPMKGSS